MDRPSIVDLFCAQVAARGPALAVESDAGPRLGYAELEELSNRLAHRLRADGAAKGQHAAILAAHSADVVVALLGCLKAGCAFVPLDAATPLPRLRAIIEQVRPELLLRDAALSGLADQLWEGLEPPRTSVLDHPSTPLAGGYASFPDATPLNSPLAPGDLAYVVFTSGSTGRPKGIAGQRKGIDHFIHWEIETLGLEPGCRISQLTSPVFDAYLRDVFTPLAAGGTVCIPAGSETLADPHRLSDWLERARVEVLHCVPTLFRSLLGAALEPARLPALRWVLLAGEPLMPGDVGRWHDVFGERIRLMNLYGPSETTMTKMFYVVRPEDRERQSIPIGKAMKGAAAMVIDGKGHPKAPGEIGEIALRTPFRSLGYFRDPERTREVFVPNPFRDDPDDLIYKTGDLGRVLADGDFEILGRKDQQVKIRGVRIELGEIEDLLRGHPAVREVAVVERRDEAGNLFLCAYFTLAQPVASAELREHLARSLPAVMVPSALRELPALPKLVTGKLDRRALKARRDSFVEIETDFIAPRGQVEALVAGLFAEILGVPRIGIHQDFFAAGGHSLSATQLLARLRESLGIELPLRALFSAPTVAGVATAVERGLASDTGLVEAGLAETGLAEAIALAGASTRDAELPLSLAQTRLWFLEQMQPEHPLYNVPIAIGLTSTLEPGALEPGALAGSLTELTRRHNALRARFATHDGRPVQRLAPPAPVALPLVDLGALATAEAERERDRLVRAELWRRFDLERGPLLRATLLRLRPSEHVVLLCLHHIACDAWSLGLAIRELAALYGAALAGSGSPLPELVVQYSDYARWQERRLPVIVERELGPWRERLAGAPTSLELPTDRPHPARPSFRGLQHRRQLDPATAAELRRLAARHGATLYMVLLAAFESFLWRHTHQRDLCVGTPVAGRGRAETHGLIGFFVNTLVLRNDLGGDPSWLELLGRVREGVLWAFAHQELPFEKLVEAQAPQRDPSRNPLFQAFFALDNTPWQSPEIRGLAWRRLRTHAGTARFELALVIEEREEALETTLELAADLFDATTGERLLRRWEALLHTIAAAPERRLGELRVMPAAERHQLVAEWNDTHRPPAGTPAHEHLRLQAECRPDAVALVQAERHWSYAGLAARVGALVSALERAGVAAGEVVGVCAARSGEQAAAVLAVVTAGRVYLPLDPALPAERLAFLLDDARVAAVVADAHGRARLPAGDVRLVPLTTPAPTERAGGWPPSRGDGDGDGDERLAYAIYTSGSTGRPKAVAITHRGLAHLAVELGRAFGLGEHSRVLQFASPSFDAAIPDLFATLASGGTICLGEEPSLAPGPELAALVARAAVSDATFPPSLLAVLEPHQLAGLGTLVVAGEACGTALAERWGRGRKLLDAYGPTENTVCTTVGAWVEGRPSIGRPLGNVRVLVLDARLEPVPIGVAGELCAAGAGLARGYLCRPALTSERFVPDPTAATPGTRLYRTGDRVRHRADGRLDFLGRIDTQLKLRGVRIEPGEIESVLLAQPEIAQAVVVAVGEGAERRLVAALAPRGEATPDPAQLRARLTALLPAQSVPAAFTVLAELPRTASGKLDRAAIAHRVARAEIAAPATTAARNPLETRLTELWAEVLGRREPVGIHDDFFALGGHSLLASRLIARVRAELGVELGVRNVFDQPTVAGLAATVEQARRLGRRPPPPIVAVPRETPLPLSFAQQGLWFLHRVAPRSAAYNVPGGVRLLGVLQPAALAAALAAIVARHEVLRSHFATVGEEAVQVIAPRLCLPLALVDLSALPAPHRLTTARRLADAEALVPFALERGPLLRCRLLRLEAEDHVLLVTLHHAVCDGGSMALLIRELTAFYAAALSGGPSPLPPLAVQYGDFALWQRRRLTEEAQATLLAHWRERLRGVDEAPLLPLRPRTAANPTTPATSPTARAATVPVRLDPACSAALETAARRGEATLFMLLLAALALALHRISGRDPLVIATDAAGRERAELEPLIGLFVNQLLVRVDLAGARGFGELLARVRREALDAYAHQELPYDRLVAALAPQRDPRRRSALFQVKLVLQEPSPALEEVGGLAVTRFEAGAESAKFDLLVNLVPTPEGLEGTFQYPAESLERGVVERAAALFIAVLEQVAASPELALDTLAAQLAAREAQHASAAERALESARRAVLGRAQRRTIKV